MIAPIIQTMQPYAWGSNSYGQLSIESKHKGECIPVPQQCSFNLMITLISCGDEHTGFLTSNGKVFMVGSNKDGRLGIGDKKLKQSHTPCLLESLSKYTIIKLSCGWGHNAVILSDGILLTWGYGKYGALGNGGNETLYKPSILPSNSPRSYQAVSCGSKILL